MNKQQRLKPLHPGEILRDEVLIPNGISPSELALLIKVPQQIIEWLCEEKINIDWELATRLGLGLNTTPDLWMNLQHHYEKDLMNLKIDELKEIIGSHEKFRRNEGFQK